jgi:hypothetical protein
MGCDPPPYRLKVVKPPKPKRHLSPENAYAAAERTRKQWSDPAKRQEMTAGIRAYFARRAAAEGPRPSP